MRYIAGTIILTYCLIFEGLSFWATGRPLYSLARITLSAFQNKGLSIFQNEAVISLLPTVAVGIVIFLLILVRLFLLFGCALQFFRGTYLIWWTLLAEAGMFCAALMQYVHPDWEHNSVWFVVMPSFWWTVVLALVPGLFGVVLERRSARLP